jgi:DNA-binding GntR family transcriptional regulator
MATSFSQIQPVSLREQVVEQVRAAIIEGRLRPGDHIAETTLTQQLGVSRTPVREALILLEREGLVTATRNRGCFVRAFNAQDVDDIFSMRTTLENFAAELIINQLDDDDFAHLRESIARQRDAIEARDFKHVRAIDMRFHRYLVERGRNPLMIRHWQEIVAQIAALLYVRAEALPDYDEYLAIRDHQSILDAYMVRDLDAVRACNTRINARVAAECAGAMGR